MVLFDKFNQVDTYKIEVVPYLLFAIINYISNVSYNADFYFYYVWFMLICISIVALRVLCQLEFSIAKYLKKYGIVNLLYNSLLYVAFCTIIEMIVTPILRLVA